MPLGTLYQFEGRKDVQVVESALRSVIYALVGADKQMVVPDSGTVDDSETAVCRPVIA